MRRKKIVRWIAGITMGLLVVMTGVSYLVYQSMLPNVITYDYTASTGRLLDGYSRWETVPWVPMKCTFPASQEDDTVYLYRIRDRAGQWNSTEYYVERVEVPVVKEGVDMLLLEDGYLGYFETLVCETTLPLHDGEAVNWLNPGTIW